MIDPIRNFAEGIVTIGYDIVTTSIILNTGDGERFPNPETEGAFNLAWFNSTDFPNPADDPNKEIVRCTARLGDVLTIIRGQEGTVATSKNIANKIYKIILPLTRKTIIDIEGRLPATKPVGIDGGGTGAITALQARANLEVASLVHSHTTTDIISGVFPIAQGGTGQTTANNALNALLPAQAGQAGRVLGTDGANASWVVGGGGGSVLQFQVFS